MFEQGGERPPQNQLLDNKHQTVVKCREMPAVHEPHPIFIEPVTLWWRLPGRTYQGCLVPAAGSVGIRTKTFQALNGIKLASNWNQTPQTTDPGAKASKLKRFSKQKRKKRGEVDPTLSCITLKIFKLTFLCDHIIVWSRFHSYICAEQWCSGKCFYIHTGLYNTTI